MKYVILIYSNPTSRQMWQSMPASKQSEGWAMYAALDADLAESGELVASEALADPQFATRVSVADGIVSSTDGPFAETKEHLVGFYLIECEDLPRATAIAARVPEASLGLVEVRPVMALSDTDM